MQVLFLFIVLWQFYPSSAFGNYLTGAEQLSAEGAQFTWPEVKSKSLKIMVEYRNGQVSWKQANLGSGFLVSPGGVFVTAYHVMKYCLQSRKEKSGFSVAVNCSTTNPRLRYKAQSENKEFEIEILSHLRERDSTSGKDIHTPDEIIKQRDFIIGRLKTKADARFSYWPLREFEEGRINLNSPDADFELKPLLPPKRVFMAGYPQNRDFMIAYGFLNLTDEKHRGYFAADYKLYAAGYLEKQGIAPDTKWGMGVDNHMSGGAVVDVHGYLVGIVVNGNAETAAVLSIENVLETFFSRAGKAGAEPAILLTPAKIPLYLRASPTN